MIGNYFYYNSSDCEITTIIILDSYKDVVDARKVKNI